VVVEAMAGVEGEAADTVAEVTEEADVEAVGGGVEEVVEVAVGDTVDLTTAHGGTTGGTTPSTTLTCPLTSTSTTTLATVTASTSPQWTLELTRTRRSSLLLSVLGLRLMGRLVLSRCKFHGRSLFTQLFGFKTKIFRTRREIWHKLFDQAGAVKVCTLATMTVLLRYKNSTINSNRIDRPLVTADHIAYL
jgi:hypothetical protein